MAVGDPNEEAAELRLALVCYGGVSLAVYMHGVTKELQSLIRAARAFDARIPPSQEDDLAIGTESAYYAALVDLAEQRTAVGAKAKRLSVSIDIIGGTSAGGINGIALSKALATGASQEPLKDVWINKGDIRSLLRAPMVWLPAQAFYAGAAQLLSRWRGITTPLKGEVMSQLIIDALGKMDDGKHEAELLPHGGVLELYVPSTDLDGFDVLVPSGAGGASNRDRQNAQVFEFRAQSGQPEQFDRDYTPDLAFAARASASFPGAFAPISQTTFASDVKNVKNAAGKKYENLKFHSDVFRSQYPKIGDGTVYFVDGGVLDNAPFDVVISAIANRRADAEVYRRLVYIEPDPGGALYSTAAELHTAKRRWLKDLLAVWKVKGNHGFVRELLALRDMNDRIGAISAITERQMAYVVGAIGWSRSAQQDRNAVDPTAPPKGFGYPAATELMTAVTGSSDIQGFSDKMHIWARDDLGPAFSTYQRLKLDAALKPLADELAGRFGFSPRSGQAAFIQAAFSAWAHQQPFWKVEPEVVKSEPSPDQLGDVLRPVDTPYRDRRLIFILAGISELYRPQKDEANPGQFRAGPAAGDLDELKRTAWTMLEHVRAIPREAVRALPSEMVGFLDLPTPGSDSDPQDDPLLDDPAVFAGLKQTQFKALFDTYSAELQNRLLDDSVALWEAFKAHSAGWRDDDRQALLSRYLGFPLWDGMLFPTLTLTQIPQLTKIGVQQFSPLMATKLKPPRDEYGKKAAKLKGIPVAHFAGFFAAANRENDYLWGRLDCAELILRLLGEVGGSMVSTATTVSSPDAKAPIPHLADALQMILDSERKPGEGKTPLTHVDELMKFLQDQVTVLKAESACPAPADQSSESVSV